MSKYSEKLKDPRWQKKRLEVFNRDGFVCSNCGNSESMLAVHHLYYEKDKDPWDYPLEAFKTICEECHEVEHSCRKEYENSLLEILRKAGFSADDVFHVYEGFYSMAADKIPPRLLSSTIWWLSTQPHELKIVINKYVDWMNAGRKKRNKNAALIERIK